jgi:hypothetical protein
LIARMVGANAFQYFRAPSIRAPRYFQVSGAPSVSPAEHTLISRNAAGPPLLMPGCAPPEREPQWADHGRAMRLSFRPS